MKPRTASLVVLLGLLSPDAAAAVLEQPAPNVVLIVVDDLAPRLGCYGDPDARTPNIDRLAAEGVRFTRAYCQGTTCNPSRASFLSGLRPRATGIFDNRNWRELDLLTIPEHFAENGYDTVKVGKVFHPPKRDRVVTRRGAPEHESRRRIWTRTLDPADAPPDDDEGEDDDEPGSQVADVAGASHFVSPSGSVSWMAQALDPLDGPDGRVAEAAARFLAEEHERPFLLAVGFAKPHLPFYAPAAWFEPFDAASLALPDAPADDLADLPAPARRRVDLEEAPDEAGQRAALRAYYACTAYVDACIGRVLDALDASGARASTIVVVTSDHGQLLGEHGLWHKGFLFDADLRVPLVVTAPGVEGGAASERLVELVDLFPTLTELCGVPTPDALEGTSFVPLLSEPERPWKLAAFTYEPNATTLRTEGWRLTRWGSGEHELYDLARDPQEHTNLAGVPEHAERLAELERLLAAGWVAANR